MDDQSLLKRLGKAATTAMLFHATYQASIGLAMSAPKTFIRWLCRETPKHMRAPHFWQTDGIIPRLLAPAAALYAATTARRLRTPGWTAPIPVICCGNATAGGSGKTTLALDLGIRLLAAGHKVAFLTRGYGGNANTVTTVNPAIHTAATVGDEPLLLASLAPTYVAANRAQAARAAIAAGATILIMDDGLQNPTLNKTVSLLVVDGASGFGNARIIPAGPLREPITTAANRCAAAILIGPDETNATARLPPTLKILTAILVPASEAAQFAGKKVIAFAGIGRPEKFFATLETTGAILAAKLPFPDHHPYTPADLIRIHALAAQHNAAILTTPKDAARLSPTDRAGITAIGVSLVWQNPTARDALLTNL